MFRMHGYGGDQTEEAMRRKGVDRVILRRAWQYAKPYKRILTVYVVAAAIMAVLAILPPLLLRDIIDKSIPNRDFAQLNILVGILVVSILVSMGLGFLTRWLGARLGEGMIADLRIALFDHVQRLPIGFFSRTQTGSLMSRLNNDVIGAQQAFTATLRSALTDFLTLVLTLVAMVALSWQITVLALIVVPPLFFITRKVGASMQRVSRDQMNRNSDMNALMTERFNVAGALLVKLFGRADEERDDFAKQARDVAAVGVKRSMTGVILFIVMPSVAALGTAAIYWLGARQVIEGVVTTGTIVALAAYVQRLYQPLTDLATVRVDFLTAMVSFERVFEVLDVPPAITEKADAVELVQPRGELTFDHVWFQFPDAADYSVASLESEATRSLGNGTSDWILSDIAFHASPGEMIALVGPSGAGKTTLGSLLPRLNDVTEGSITIDGLDVRDLTLQSLIDSVGVVTQDAHLFHDTIAGNLRYAKPNATLDQVIEACKAARIHEMISSLPEAYDTVVGERGYRLSGGEKARLTIARVLLKDPAIVVLDEATAHLDSETEVQIQRALDVALAGRTSIVIAHRLSTIQAADQILVVEHGRIVEHGVHQELIDQGGLYAELYRTQFERPTLR